MVSLVASEESSILRDGSAAPDSSQHQALSDNAGEREGNSSRREQILAAAWKALSEVGFERITTRRIADEAGINIATLSYHLGGKESVLTETMRYAQQSTDALMRNAVAHAQNAREMMEIAFETSMRLMKERPGVLRFDLAVRGFRDADARREAEGVYGRYRWFVCEIVQRHLNEGGTLAEGLTAETLAEYVIAMMDGIVLHYTLFSDEVAAERKAALLKRHVLDLMNLPQH